MIRIKHTKADGSQKSETQREQFNVPEVLGILKGLAAEDGDMVLVEADQDPVDGKERPSVKIFGGLLTEAVSQFEKSAVPDEAIVAEFSRFVEVMLSHSNLRGVEVSIVWDDKRSPDGSLVHGFAKTSHLATRGDYMRLYGTSSANNDKFAAAAGIGQEKPQDGGIIIPESAK